MSGIQVRIISKGSQLPPMECQRFFHSVELFRIAERTPGHSPYMVVAENDRGEVVAHLLALVRWNISWFPPYLYTQGRIYGEGEYLDEINKEEIFGMMLRQITKLFKRRLALYTEFSDISQKMFGYKHFRECGYFPINWQEIHNSLHSKSPVQRLNGKAAKHLLQAKRNGVVAREVQNTAEIHQFYSLLKEHFRMKVRRFIPPESLFHELYRNPHAKKFITLYKKKVIGGCACVYSKKNASLWYLASKRKTYRHLHPDTATVWCAIEHAYTHHYEHVYFLDAGLPFKKSRFRDFILSFGGKPVTKYRWFRISIPWLNKFFSWLYRE